MNGGFSLIKISKATDGLICSDMRGQSNWNQIWQQESLFSPTLLEEHEFVAFPYVSPCYMAKVRQACCVSVDVSFCERQDDHRASACSDPDAALFPCGQLQQRAWRHDDVNLATTKG